MEQTAVRAHTGWREDEIDRLWDGIRQANASGEPLRTVFEEMGKSLGRKPNSVRNFYYMQLRRRDGADVRRAAPFETFTEDEVRALVRDVLVARSRGQSVRSAVMALSQGDRARMLRYQNKYRSVLKKRPELVSDVVEELRQEGIVCPISPLGRPPEKLMEEVQEKANALADPAVQKSVDECTERLGSNGRVLLRKSGTEPVLRVMAEAGTLAECEANVDAIIEAMKVSGHLIEVKK